MGSIAGHFVLHSIGLVVVFASLVPALRFTRRDPLLSHSLLRGALYAVLLLVPLQVLLHGRWSAGAVTARAVSTSLAVLVPKPAGEAFAPPRARSTTGTSETSRHASAPAADATPILGVRSRVASDHVEAAAGGSTPLGALDAAPGWTGFDVAVSLAWVLGALVVLIVQLARLHRTRVLLATAWPVTDGARLEAWNRAARGSRLARRVRLLESRRVSSPACWGVLRGTIVLPADAGRFAGGPSLEWALLHELVHLERGDPRDALLQRLLTTLFWFHPAAWWLTRELDRAREVACDRQVVVRGGRPRSYALALLDSAAREGAPVAALVPPSHLLPWSPSPSQLRRRIEMLTTRHAPLSPRRRLVYGLGASALLSACWAGQLAIASTFDAGDERLVARCDPKKKAKPRAPQAPSPERFQVPRPADTPARSSEADVVRENVPLDGALPVRLDERSRQWVVPRSSLDHEVRDSLVRALLHDDSAEVRAAAAETLSAHLDDESVKKAFLRAIGNGCEKTRARLLDDLLAREAVSADLRDLLTRLLGETDASQSAVARAFLAADPGPEARQVLIGALRDERDSVVQLSAAEALSPHSSDASVRQALLAALKQGHNEVARMAMIRALEPHVADPEVRATFQYLIPRDDNEVAVHAMAEALARRVDDEGVRASMIEVLLGSRNDVVKVRFAETLAPYVHVPEVKRAFIAVLPKLGNEVIRMRMVTALASLVDPGAPPSPARRPHALPLPGPAEGSIVPVLKQG